MYVFPMTPVALTSTSLLPKFLFLDSLPVPLSMSRAVSPASEIDGGSENESLVSTMVDEMSGNPDAQQYFRVCCPLFIRIVTAPTD